MEHYLIPFVSWRCPIRSPSSSIGPTASRDLNFRNVTTDPTSSEPIGMNESRDFDVLHARKKHSLVAFPCSSLAKGSWKLNRYFLCCTCIRVTTWTVIDSRGPLRCARALLLSPCSLFRSPSSTISVYFISLFHRRDKLS